MAVAISKFPAKADTEVIKSAGTVETPSHTIIQPYVAQQAEEEATPKRETETRRGRKKKTE